MRPFEFQRAASADEAARLGATGANAAAAVHAPVQYLAGGTTVLDLMKLDVMRPQRLVDINDLGGACATIETGRDGLWLGALVRMAQAQAHPAVRRDYPMIHDALRLAASPQLRNMASLGGNVLQRTRCSYFRDTRWAACNKRAPGSGCAAIGGVARRLAVLGVSGHCIANYPGDFAVALAALGAQVELLDAGGRRRSLAFDALHRLPADTPQQETDLLPGELITGFRVPSGPWTRRSLYLKVRDRASYDFALASAAVGLDLDEDGVVRAARIGLGGLAAKPWRAREAEALLAGQRLDERSAGIAAKAAFAGAVIQGDNAFKPELGRRTLVRALLEAARMELADER